MSREDFGICLCLFLLFVHVLFVCMCCLSSVCVVTVTFPKLQRVGTQIMINSIVFFCIKLIDIMFDIQIFLFTVSHGS